MSKWRNFQAMNDYFPHTADIDGKQILTYHCDNCGGPILATSPLTRKDYLTSISYMRFCPHCGNSMESLRIRDEEIPILTDDSDHTYHYYNIYGRILDESE